MRESVSRTLCEKVSRNWRVETDLPCRSWEGKTIENWDTLSTREAESLNTIPPNTEKWLRKLYMKTMATVYSYENKCATNYIIITNNNWNDAYNMQLTKHDTNDDVDTLHLHFNGLVAYMHWGCTRIFVPQLVIIHAHLMAQVLSTFITPICMDIHGALSLIRLLPFLPPLPPVCLSLPLPLRAVHWAPQHEVHGKQPALLRCRREWGHPERHHISHRLWAQAPCLRRALRLISLLLPHDPVLGPRHGWPDTRRDAHCGTPRTSRLLRTRRHVSQSVSRRL